VNLLFNSRSARIRDDDDDDEEDEVRCDVIGPVR
jgi:hypothetical protein